MCEELIRNVYTYFQYNAKRRSDFAQFQTFCNIKPHKLLHPSQPRWLSLENNVTRIVEQWQSLQEYFKKIYEKDNLQNIEHIMEALQDPSIILYYKFLSLYYV